jgi:hypothetical protein
MSSRWDVGDEPSLFCAFDRHEECMAASSKNCTCRCHYWTETGLHYVCDIHLEDER